MGTAGLRAWGALSPANATMCSALASHGLVICRNGVPVLTQHHGGRPPPDDGRPKHVQKARSMAEVKRSSLVPPGARRPGPARLWDDWSGPGPHVPQLDEPFRSSAGRISSGAVL